jgi:hypothetical protein
MGSVSAPRSVGFLLRVAVCTTAEITRTGMHRDFVTDHLMHRQATFVSMRRNGTARDQCAATQGDVFMRFGFRERTRNWL